MNNTYIFSDEEQISVIVAPTKEEAITLLRNSDSFLTLFDLTAEITPDYPTGIVYEDTHYELFLGGE